MSDLRLFMSQRKQQIREEFDPLLVRRQALRTELEEVTTKLFRLKTELEEIEKAERAIAGEEEPTSASLTIKQAVMKVLEEEKRGMTAQEILAAINERFFDGRVPRSSLSPQLSRLNHDDKKITYDGTLWSLRNEEGPENSEPSFLD